MSRIVDCALPCTRPTIFLLLRPAARMVTLRKQKNEIRRRALLSGSLTACAFVSLEAVLSGWAGGWGSALTRPRQSEQPKFDREPHAEVVTSSRKSTVRGLTQRAKKAALGLCAGTR